MSNEVEPSVQQPPRPDPGVGVAPETLEPVGKISEAQARLQNYEQRLAQLQTEHTQIAQRLEQTAVAIHQCHGAIVALRDLLSIKV